MRSITLTIPTIFGLVNGPLPMRYVFVNFVFKASWGVQSVRSVGTQNRIFIGGFYSDHPCVVFTSFGSPYHLRMFNVLPNYLNALLLASESALRCRHGSVKWQRAVRVRWHTCCGPEGYQ